MLFNSDSSSYKLVYNPNNTSYKLQIYKTSVFLGTKDLSTFPSKAGDYNNPTISKLYNPQTEKRFMKSTYLQSTLFATSRYENYSFGLYKL